METKHKIILASITVILSAFVLIMIYQDQEGNKNLIDPEIIKYKIRTASCMIMCSDKNMSYHKTGDISCSCYNENDEIKDFRIIIDYDIHKKYTDDYSSEMRGEKND